MDEVRRRALSVGRVSVIPSSAKPIGIGGGALGGALGDGAPIKRRPRG
jgi:hypothetical protein